MSENSVHNTENDNIGCLAHLIRQKYINDMLYERKSIPEYMHEQANETLLKKINELEKLCYTCI